jgi:hypothetical protein
MRPRSDQVFLLLREAPVRNVPVGIHGRRLIFRDLIAFSALHVCENSELGTPIIRYPASAYPLTAHPVTGLRICQLTT